MKTALAYMLVAAVCSVALMVSLELYCVWSGTEYEVPFGLGCVMYFLIYIAAVVTDIRSTQRRTLDALLKILHILIGDDEK